MQTFNSVAPSAASKQIGKDGFGRPPLKSIMLTGFDDISSWLVAWAVYLQIAYFKSFSTNSHQKSPGHYAHHVNSNGGFEISIKALGTYRVRIPTSMSLYQSAPRFCAGMIGKKLPMIKEGLQSSLAPISNPR